MKTKDVIEEQIEQVTYSIGVLFKSWIKNKDLSAEEAHEKVQNILRSFSKRIIEATALEIIEEDEEPIDEFIDAFVNESNIRNELRSKQRAKLLTMTKEGEV